MKDLFNIYCFLEDPYIMVDGRCHYEMSVPGTGIKGYVNVSSGDVNALKHALIEHGPISVAIDASHSSFVFYSSGVYYEPKCGNTMDSLDHAVLLVGYGSENGEDYWLIKNSWSPLWGDKGYVKMSMKGNNCGVATQPTFVLL